MIISWVGLLALGAYPVSWLTDEQLPKDAPRELVRAWARGRYERRLARLPKLECRLHKLTVYDDAVVTEASFTNTTKEALRLPMLVDLWLQNTIVFKDQTGDRWVAREELKNHYHWAPESIENTYLIGAEETTRLCLVDTLEEPRFHNLSEADAGRPDRLNYRLNTYWRLNGKDIGGYNHEVHLRGGGQVDVIWVRKPIPRGTQTTVVKESKP
jgi:hypothetical protein